MPANQQRIEALEAELGLTKARPVDPVVGTLEQVRSAIPPKDWSQLGAVMRYAIALGGHMAVVRQPGRRFYNVVHADRQLPADSIVLWRT